MSSTIPCTEFNKTSFAASKALTRVIFLPKDCNLSLGIMMRESTCFSNSFMPSSAY